MHAAVPGSDWHELATRLGAAREDLLAYCVRLVRSPSEAEDLVQQVFLATLTRSELDLTRPLLPWMRRVAKNRAVDRYRAQRRERDELPSQIPDDGSAPADRTSEAARGAAGAWLAVVGSLRPQQRAVLLLRDLLDFSGAETAAALGISEANAKVLLHRARAALVEAGSRSPELTQGRDARAASALLAGSPGNARYEPRRILGVASAADSRLESRAAWSVWASLLQAMERSVPPGSDLAVRVELARLIAHRGDDAQAHEARIDGARRAAAELGDPALIADVELVAGAVLLPYGRVDRAQQAFERVLAMEGVSPAVQGYAANGIAGVHWRAGRFEEARRAYAIAAERADSPQRRDMLLHNIALLDAMSGRLESALASGREALANHRAAGRLGDAFETLVALGMALQNHRRLDEAEARFREALALKRAHGLTVSDGGARINLGLVAHERGELAEAETLFERALAEARRTGRTRRAAIALGNLGVTRHRRGQLAAAAVALDEAVALAEPLDVPHLLGFLLAHRAAVHASACAPEQAARDLGSASTLLHQLGEPRMLEVLQALQALVAVRSSDEPAAERSARAALEALSRPTSEEPAAMDRFAAVRIAVDLLEQALDR